MVLGIVEVVFGLNLYEIVVITSRCRKVERVCEIVRRTCHGVLIVDLSFGSMVRPFRDRVR